MARAILTRLYANPVSTPIWQQNKSLLNEPTSQQTQSGLVFNLNQIENHKKRDLRMKPNGALHNFIPTRICDICTQKTYISNETIKSYNLKLKRLQKFYAFQITSLALHDNSTFHSTIFQPMIRQIHTISPDIPKMSVAEMKKEFKQKSIAVVDGYTTLVMQCVLCDGRDKGAMHVNKTTGYFSCASCHAYGEWSVLLRALRFGVSDERVIEHVTRTREEHERVTSGWEDIMRSTDPLDKLDEATAESVFSLHEWPYNKETSSILCEARCRVDDSSVYFPLRNCGSSIVGWRQLDQRGQVASSGRSGLFTCRAIRQTRSEQAVLVPSVSDLLHLAKDRVPGLLVWWYGCVLPPAVLPILEAFKKIVVWGAAENVMAVGDKLNQDRCRFVRPVKAASSATEAASLCRPGELRAAVSEAAPAAHRSITNFNALRKDVYANVTNAEKTRGIKWKRFPSLTKLLGGHRRGELTVLTGATGCGKTTLAAEMSLDLAYSGVSTLWGSFEIRNSRLVQTMLQQHAGVPLETNLPLFDKFADEFEKLPIHFLAFHGPQPIPLVMEAVEHARYVHDIAHVIVDNVQFMLGVGNGDSGAPGDRYFRQDAVVAAFRTFATRRDCHVTLVMHPRKEREADDLSTSSIFGSAKASQEADNVLIIQDKRLTAVRGKKYLQVAKNRFSGDLGVVPLDFDKLALSYKQTKRPKDKETKQKQDEERDQGQDAPEKA